MRGHPVRHDVVPVSKPPSKPARETSAPSATFGTRPVPAKARSGSSVRPPRKLDATDAAIDANASTSTVVRLRGQMSPHTTVAIPVTGTNVSPGWA